MLKAIYSHVGNFLFPRWELFILMLGTTCLMAVFFHPAPLASTPPLKGWGAEKSNRKSLPSLLVFSCPVGNQLPSHHRGGVSEAGVG